MSSGNGRAIPKGFSRLFCLQAVVCGGWRGLAGLLLGPIFSTASIVINAGAGKSRRQSGKARPDDQDSGLRSRLDHTHPQRTGRACTARASLCQRLSRTRPLNTSYSRRSMASESSEHPDLRAVAAAGPSATLSDDAVRRAPAGCASPARRRDGPGGRASARDRGGGAPGSGPTARGQSRRPRSARGHHPRARGARSPVTAQPGGAHRYGPTSGLHLPGGPGAGPCPRARAGWGRRTVRSPGSGRS